MRIGILGGGQLALMLSQASFSLGLNPKILAQKESDPALKVTRDFVLNTDSPQTMKDFFESVDRVTIENEFVDLSAFENLGELTKKLFPSVDVLRLVQSKRDQKIFLAKNKFPTLDFSLIDSISDLERAYLKFGGRLVVKQSRLGYDGRGTFIFRGKKDSDAFLKFKESLQSTALKDYGYAEPLADFKQELAVVSARNHKNQIVSYPVIQTFQDEGICQWAMAPSYLSNKSEQMALHVARRLMSKLKAIGVFAVEMFQLKDGRVVINEIAPRVHNSGHLTLTGASTSQFEQHLRAGFGLPLGDGKLFKPSAMVNIIGKKKIILDHDSQIPLDANAIPIGTGIYWYGKVGDSLKRKLGHINATAKTPKEALKKAMMVRKKINI
jgi:5-(carboxyamino)imidazole ribonucleotide synthase